MTAGRGRWPDAMSRRLVAATLAALLLLAGTGGAAAADLPALKGADWPRIFQGRAGTQGEMGGFSAPGPNGYPRGCTARAGTCGPMQCCGAPCNARADGRPAAAQAWPASVYLRQDCRSPWQAGPAAATMFPTGWPDSRIRATVLSAYRAGRAVAGGPDGSGPGEGGSGMWCGCAGTMTLFGRQADGLVTAAWPSLDKTCGCEAVPLRHR